MYELNGIRLEKECKVREIIEFFKELVLLKKDEKNFVGLTSFKKRPKLQISRKPKKKVNRELNLSELMRKS